MKCVCCVQSQSVVGNIPQMRLRLERLELLLLLPPALSSLAEEGEEEEEAGGVGLGSGAGDPSPSGGAVGVMQVVVMVGLVLWCWLAGLCRELKVGKIETRGEASHSVNQRGQAIQWFRSHCLNDAYSVIEIAPFRHYGERLPSFQGMCLVVSMLLPFMRHLGPLLGGRSGLTRPVLLVKSLLFLAMFCLLTQVSQCCCH